MKYLTVLKQEGLNPVQILIVAIFGGIALRIAYLSIFYMDLFFFWVYRVPFYSLCVLTLLYLIRNIRQYLRERKILALLPCMIGAIITWVVITQQRKRESWDKELTVFKVSTDQIGNDGGLLLDFKSNGILKATKMDLWAITEYWGTYRREKDTVDLDIPLDFELGKKAVLEEHALRFLDDTRTFTRQ